MFRYTLDGEFIVDTETGERLTIEEAPFGALAETLARAKATKSRISAVESFVGDEVLRRFDKRGKWTLEEDGFKVSGTSPDTRNYSIDSLREVLGGLVKEGLIDEEAMEEATPFPPPKEPERKIDKRKVEGLRKANPVVRERIDAVSTPGRRSVKLDEIPDELVEGFEAPAMAGAGRG